MKLLSTSGQPRSSSAQTYFYIGFAFATLLAVRYLRAVDSAHSDPSALFFNATRAYGLRYSSVRIAEAEDFIENASEFSQRTNATADPTVCVGIATVQREDARYFRVLVGSLLEGLSIDERNDFVLMPFIANIDPDSHQAYKEPWLHQVSDEVITYHNVSASDKARLASKQTPKGHKEKALFDYSYMLESCLKTNAPYLLVLEDDVLAADGWYSRMIAAIQDLESRPQYPESVYLRLFYNTRLHGWNSETWPHYLFWSVVFELCLVGIILFLRRNTAASELLTPWMVSTILVVCAPVVIGLFFAAGRLTVMPFPTGIHQMNNFGCCSQAFVFPRQQVPPLLEYFKHKRYGMRDELIEEYSDERGLERWALTPSVFQHVGTRSSKWGGPGSDKVDENGLISTQRIWNYAFESWDAKALREEHRSLT